MKLSVSDELQVPTVEEIMAKLKIAGKRAPRLLIIFNMMMELFEDMNATDDDVEHAMTFFHFCCGHPRPAMFLACAGEFLRGADDQQDTSQAVDTGDWGNEPTLTGEPLPTLAS